MNDSMRPEVATLGCTFLSILISCTTALCFHLLSLQFVILDVTIRFIFISLFYV